MTKQNKLIMQKMKQSITQAYKYPGFEGLDRNKPFTVTASAKLAQIQIIIDELERMAIKEQGGQYQKLYKKAVKTAILSMLKNFR